MYNQNAIDTLINRVGWADAIPPTTILVSDENKESQSGRYFASFNPLATVENVKASINNKDADNDTLNDYLAQLRFDGVMDVLLKVYNQNIRAGYPENNGIISLKYAADYSLSIEVNQNVFDDAIGLAVSIKALELLVTTNRSNTAANNPSVKKEDVLEFLHGAFAPTGRVVTKGLYAQYRESVGKIIDILFPVQYPTGAETTVNPDGTVSVKAKPQPKIKGIKPW